MIVRVTGRAGAVLALAVVVAARDVASQESAADSAAACWRYGAPGASFRVEVVAHGLTVPVGLAFLPDGRALVAERPVGRLSFLELRTGALTPIAGVPAVEGKVDGGLLDVVPHPDFARNGWIYFAYSEHTDSGNALVVERARLAGSRLEGRQRLLTGHPFLDNADEFGARLVLDRGYLYIATGQRDVPRLAQDLSSNLGKIIRLREDGGVPPDNPFVARPGALPEIWSLGHRNSHGLAVDPATGELWEHEHGPRGGDEINVIRPGRNYGWPVITYGLEYSGDAVGAGLTQRAGMEQPVHYYVPSIAPSGMAFYSGADIPGWRGSLFLGSLTYRHLNRVELRDGRVVREERLLRDRGWRIREVRRGPDGYLYLGIESGLVVRVRSDDAATRPRDCSRGVGVDDPWQATDARPPVGGDGAAAAYASGARVVVSFGGRGGGGAPAGATREWNGAAWRQVAADGPAPRVDAWMATEPGEGVLLFGGTDAADAALEDSWRYRDGAWTKLDVTAPPGRSGAAAAYDFDHRRVILFGGARGARRTPLGDTWVWDGRRWTLAARAGPAPRSGAAMTYDPSTRTVLLFGGRDASGRPLADSWRWDGARWRKVVGGGPPPRAGAFLVYSPSRQRVLLVGGSARGTSRADAWQLDGDRWRPLRLSTPRVAAALFVADPARDRIVLVGADSAGGAPRTYLLLR